MILKNAKFFSFLVLISIVFPIFSQCSSLEIIPRETDIVREKRETNSRPMTGLNEKTGGSFFGNLGLGGNNNIDLNTSVTFQTALDKLSFMPLASVDASAGIIVTDWHSINNNETRIKIHLRVLDQELSDNSVSVKVFNQEFDGTKWITIESDSSQSLKIKNSILQDARKLKATLDL